MTTDNGAAQHTDPDELSAEDVADWLTITEAEARTGTPRRTIERLAEQGRIKRGRDAEGRYRYHPEDVDDEAIVRPVGRRTDKDKDRSPSADVIEESFKGGASLLKQAHHHLERMMGLTTTLVDKNTQALREENNALRAQVDKLQTGYWGAVTAREQALNEQQSRDLELRIEMDKEARRSRMVKVFEDKAPGILDKLLDGNAGDLQKASLALDLVKEFQPAQLAAFLEMDFLTDSQKSKLRKLLGVKEPEKTETPAAETTPATTETETEATAETTPATTETTEGTG